MTNKLRSVIEKWKEETFDDPKALTEVYSVCNEDIQDLLTMQLDAIIEEIPAIPDYDFLDVSKTTEEKMLEGCERLGAHKYRQSVLSKLQQAREELSTI